MNDQSPLHPREDYYARGASWAEDWQDSLRLSRRIAWLVAGIAIGIALLEAVALALLIPLKTVVPYTLLVDRTTGYVQVLKGTSPDNITPDAALTQALLAQYVIAREGFDIAMVGANYRKVALWSGEPVRSAYMAMMDAANPASPLQSIPRTSIAAVHVKSVSPLAENAALVRFDVEQLAQGQLKGPTEAFVSVVRFRFSGAPMALEDRVINPLGFQVTHYRRDQEAPSPAAVTQAPPGPIAAQASSPQLAPGARP